MLACLCQSWEGDSHRCSTMELMSRGACSTTGRRRPASGIASMRSPWSWPQASETHLARAQYGRMAALALCVLVGCWMGTMSADAEQTREQTATFAGGCFWGMEKVFGELPGVVSTRVGYTGGTTPNPGYEMVCTGRTGHAEAIEVTYDPARVSYDDLLEFFFTHHNPTTLNRQGNDVGTQYRSAIFYHTSEQQAAAASAVEALTRAKVFHSPIVTAVEPAGELYPAEEYHQQYLKKNPNGYCDIQLQSAKVREVLRAAR